MSEVTYKEMDSQQEILIRAETLAVEEGVLLEPEEEEEEGPVEEQALIVAMIRMMVYPLQSSHVWKYLRFE